MVQVLPGVRRCLRYEEGHGEVLLGENENEVTVALEPIQAVYLVMPGETGLFVKLAIDHTGHQIAYAVHRCGDGL